MAYLDFLSPVHKATKRDYRQRVLDHDKADCAERALQFGYDYWDGERHLGYGGYRYDGRWRPVAEAIAKHYDNRGPRYSMWVVAKRFCCMNCRKLFPVPKLLESIFRLMRLSMPKKKFAPFCRSGRLRVFRIPTNPLIS